MTEWEAISKFNNLNDKNRRTKRLANKYREKSMLRKPLLVITFLLTTTLSNAADNIDRWQLFNFSQTTPDEVTMLFGPPSLIKTEEKYSDWIKNQALGCGQLQTYAMSYSFVTGDLHILEGPLGKASEVEVVIDNGKVIEVDWIYDNNQLEPALQKWMSHPQISTTVGKKPSVVMLGKWKPKKGTILFANCYTGGDSTMCRGPISVFYSEDHSER